MFSSFNGPFIFRASVGFSSFEYGVVKSHWISLMGSSVSSSHRSSFLRLCALLAYRALFAFNVFNLGGLYPTATRWVSSFFYNRFSLGVATIPFGSVETNRRYQYWAFGRRLLGRSSVQDWGRLLHHGRWLEASSAPFAYNSLILGSSVFSRQLWRELSISGLRPVYWLGSRRPLLVRHGGPVDAADGVFSTLVSRSPVGREYAYSLLILLGSVGTFHSRPLLEEPFAVASRFRRSFLQNSLLSLYGRSLFGVRRSSRFLSRPALRQRKYRNILIRAFYPPLDKNFLFGFRRRVLRTLFRAVGIRSSSRLVGVLSLMSGALSSVLFEQRRLPLRRYRLWRQLGAMSRASALSVGRFSFRATVFWYRRFLSSLQVRVRQQQQQRHFVRLRAVLRDFLRGTKARWGFRKKQIRFNLLRWAFFDLKTQPKLLANSLNPAVRHMYSLRKLSFALLDYGIHPEYTLRYLRSLARAYRRLRFWSRYRQVLWLDRQVYRSVFRSRRFLRRFRRLRAGRVGFRRVRLAYTYRLVRTDFCSKLVLTVSTFLRRRADRSGLFRKRRSLRRGRGGWRQRSLWFDMPRRRPYRWRFRRRRGLLLRSRLSKIELPAQVAAFRQRLSFCSVSWRWRFQTSRFSRAVGRWRNFWRLRWGGSWSRSLYQVLSSRLYTFLRVRRVSGARVPTVKWYIINMGSSFLWRKLRRQRRRLLRRMGYRYASTTLPISRADVLDFLSGRFLDRGGWGLYNFLLSRDARFLYRLILPQLPTYTHPTTVLPNRYGLCFSFFYDTPWNLQGRLQFSALASAGVGRGVFFRDSFVGIRGVTVGRWRHAVHRRLLFAQHGILPKPPVLYFRPRFRFIRFFFRRPGARSRADLVKLRFSFASFIKPNYHSRFYLLTTFRRARLKRRFLFISRWRYRLLWLFASPLPGTRTPFYPTMQRGRRSSRSTRVHVPYLFRAVPARSLDFRYSRVAVAPPRRVWLFRKGLFSPRWVLFCGYNRYHATTVRRTHSVLGTEKWSSG